MTVTFSEVPLREEEQVSCFQTILSPFLSIPSTLFFQGSLVEENDSARRLHGPARALSEASLEHKEVKVERPVRTRSRAASI